MRKRVFTLFTVLLLALWGLNCESPDDCDSCPKPDPAAPNLAYMTIINLNPQATQVQIGTTDFFWQEAILWSYYGLNTFVPSQENIVVTAITIQDTFTGLGNMTEIQNLKIMAAEYPDCAVASNPLQIVGTAVTVAGTSPQQITINLDLPIVVTVDGCAKIRIVGDLSMTADATTPGTHTFEFIGLTAYSLDSFSAVTEENEHLYVFHQSGEVTNLTNTPGALTVSVDDWSPIGKILIDGTQKQTVAVFKLEADNQEDLKLQSLKITDIGAGTGVSTCYLYSDVRNDGGSIADPIAVGVMAPISPPFCQFNLADNTVIINAGTSITLTIKVDINNVDGVNLFNEDELQIAISDPTLDVSAMGMSSGMQINADAGEEKASQMLIFQSRPYFRLNPTSPTGNFTPSISTTIAIFDISAHVGGDITFDADLSTETRFLNFELYSQCQIPHQATIRFHDDQGNLLLQTLVGVCNSGPAYYATPLFPANFTIAAGTTRSIVVSLDTWAITGPGSVIRIALLKNFRWGINGSGAYMHEDLIMNLPWPGIYANPLFLTP